ncbi:MAG: hypothetical protein E5X46_31765, partial [Mesorhizobium sp.]
MSAPPCVGLLQGARGRCWWTAPPRVGYARAIPGKVCNGFPSGIAQKQILRAVRRNRGKTGGVWARRSAVVF